MHLARLWLRPLARVYEHLTSDAGEKSSLVSTGGRVRPLSNPQQFKNLQVILE